MELDSSVISGDSVFFDGESRRQFRNVDDLNIFLRIRKMEHYLNRKLTKSEITEVEANYRGDY